MASDSILQPTFKTLLLVKFGVLSKKNTSMICGILSEKAIKILFPITYLCEAGFLHILQPKRQIATD